MRLTIVILAATVSASACARAEAPASAASNPTSTNASSTTANAPAVVPVATAGTIDPAAAKRVTVREITIPAGTTLPVILDTSVGSDTSRVEQPVSAHLSRPVVVRGQTVLMEGTRVGGVVTDATRSGKVK